MIHFASIAQKQMDTKNIIMNNNNKNERRKIYLLLLLENIATNNKLPCVWLKSNEMHNIFWIIRFIMISSHFYKVAKYRTRIKSIHTWMLALGFSVRFRCWFFIWRLLVSNMYLHILMRFSRLFYRTNNANVKENTKKQFKTGAKNPSYIIHKE